MSRLVNMGDLKIKSQSRPTISNTVQVGAIATTYVYRDVAPAAAVPPPTRPRPGAQR